MAKKSDAKKSQAARLSKRRPLPVRLQMELSQIADLLRPGKWDEALPFLDDLDRRYPGHEDLLELLVQAAAEAGDAPRLVEACESLLRLRPEDADITLTLGEGQLACGFPALALQTLEQVARIWPDHEDIEHVRELVDSLRPPLLQSVGHFGLPEEQALQLAALNDRTNLLMQQGHSAQARQVAREALDLNPRFAPALNNISLTYLAEGKLDKALQELVKVLDFEPDNINTLSNLVHLCCMLGRSEEGAGYAARLKASTARASERAFKVVEALSYLGDDGGVIAAYQAASPRELPLQASKQAYLAHLAAVAHWRLDDEAQANRLWEEALRLDPNEPTVRANLDEVEKPLGESHGPWAFSKNNWINRATAAEFLGPASRLRPGDGIGHKRVVRAFLRAHPEVADVIPALLDRGDPPARSLALLLATHAGTPQMAEVVRDFALSQRGPDLLRQQAAQVAIREGLLQPGNVRLWVQGEWQELMLFDLELVDEPLIRHGKRVQTLLEDAVDALHEDDGLLAETLLREALEAEPHAPDLLNNLAAAVEFQGRPEEAEELVRRAFESDPDYPLARAGLAAIHLIHGETEPAHELLQIKHFPRRLNYEGLALWAETAVRLHLAQGDLKAARSWVAFWSGADPEHNRLPATRRRVLESERRAHA